MVATLVIKRCRVADLEEEFEQAGTRFRRIEEHLHGLGAIAIGGGRVALNTSPPEYPPRADASNTHKL